MDTRDAANIVTSALLSWSMGTLNASRIANDPSGVMLWLADLPDNPDGTRLFRITITEVS